MFHHLVKAAWAFVPNSAQYKLYDEYFDHEWYIENYPEAKIDENRQKDSLRSSALRHYLRTGWKIGYNPNVYFDTNWYLEQCAEAKRAGVEPLRHYIEKGWHEGRAPSAYFDSFWYLQKYDDVAKSGMEPLLHYLRHGWLERRNPNPYFDGAWYVRQLSLSEYRTSEPLRHYIEKGWRAGLSPSPEFDPEDYLRRHEDCREAGIDPLKHYLLAGGPPDGLILPLPIDAQGGDKEGQTNHLRRGREAFAPSQARYFSLSPAPLVSVIIPNFNGAAHLKDLFESLQAQTYKNFEIIFVDDASSDNSVEIAKDYKVDALIASPKNVGFAEANNLGLQRCRGELIAVLNNDMRVDPNWLENMISAIKQNPMIAAVAPKIRFWTKFQRLRIEGASAFEIDESALLESLEYRKYFVPQGRREGDRLHSAQEEAASAIVLHLPIQTQEIRLRLYTDKAQQITINPGVSKASSVHLSEGMNDCSFKFSYSDLREGYFVINNAGSALTANLEPYDKGFGYVDDGEFDHAEELDLFCGGSALIRRDALHGRKLFISELFAYYEDSELSVWLRDNGYKIVYCPRAIVYHKHSASTVEKSAFWLRQTNRNKIIFDYIVAEPGAKPSIVEQGRLYLNHLRHWWTTQPGSTASEREFAQQIPELYDEIDKIVALIDSGDAIKNRAPRIGIFNPYWRTLGGGEAHALEVAAALTSFGQVELISTSNFDVKSLLEYFGHEEGLNVRKRIISDFVPEVTRDYDIFVNSCFLNETPSLAKKSYFIVSFPSRKPPEEFLKSYHFLSNSGYTLECMRRFWGEDAFRGEVLYPSTPSAFYVTPEEKENARKKVILSVGRFVSTGHIKNQLEIVEAFREFVTSAPEISNGWRLVLVGSVNDRDYLSKVKDACAGLDVVLATQASFEELRNFYREASIYVHASGYGRDPLTESELFEHFGIAVAQSLASGCLPLVFDAGGPKEIVEAAGVGRTWRDIGELVEALRDSIALYASPQGEELSRKAIEAAEVYSTERLASRVSKLALYGG